MQEQRSYLPSADHIGILISSVLLTFALTRLIQSPRLTLILELPGFYFALPITIGTIMTLLAAGVTAAGMDWLIHTHHAIGTKSNIEHIMLPTITTFVIGALLTILPYNRVWWIGFGVSALLLIGVFLAEYVTIDPSAPSYAFARAGLTSLAYGLFLILIISLRVSGARMFILVPAIFIFAGLISIRILHLDGTDRWDYPWAIGIGIICTQISAGLHYWPLTPIQFGLALIGPFYGLTVLSLNLAENIPVRRASIGPLLITFAAWVSAAFL